MTLGFSQQINGKPNYFIDKIWCGLLEQGICGIFTYSEFVNNHKKKFGSYWESVKRPAPDLKPKLHTIRDDPHNRWKPGVNIHMVVNNRSKNRFQFAPVIKCTSTQDIEIKWFESKKPIESWMGAVHNPKEYLYALIKINGKQVGHTRMREIAINDGFNSIEDFFAYFNKDFKGKIIHWTDLQY